MSSKYVTIDISERTSIAVSRFQGTVWYHIKNKKKDKSVSITKEELKTLFGKKDKLIHAASKVSRPKKRRREETDSEGGSDTTLCFDSDN